MSATKNRFFQILTILFLCLGGLAQAEEYAEGGLDMKAPHLFDIPLPGGYSLPFSNSMFMLLLAVIVLAALVKLATRKMSLIPGKAQNFVEMCYEMLYNLLESIIGRRMADKYFWYFGTTFTLIILSNYMGLIPGVGVITYEGTPLLRGANADMNVTMFLGFFFAALWLVWSIREQGLKHFLLHIFGPKGNLTGFIGIVILPLFLFIGVIECVSIAIRPIALGARLYGNIYAGESIIETMAHVATPWLSWLAVLPFLLMELLIGFIQALVFFLLTAIFLKMQVGEDTEHHADEKHGEKDLPAPDHGQTVGVRNEHNQ